jgi:hypothetical protein
MNRTVCWSSRSRRLRASSITARSSLTPDESAESATKCRLPTPASSRAMVVLPVPGGP